MVDFMYLAFRLFFSSFHSSVENILYYMLNSQTTSKLRLPWFTEPWARPALFFKTAFVSKTHMEPTKPPVYSLALVLSQSPEALGPQIYMTHQLRCHEHRSACSRQGEAIKTPWTRSLRSARPRHTWASREFTAWGQRAGLRRGDILESNVKMQQRWNNEGSPGRSAERSGAVISKSNGGNNRVNIRLF